jgi:hypothetical protein
MVEIKRNGAEGEEMLKLFRPRSKGEPTTASTMVYDESKAGRFFVSSYGD